MTTTRTSPETSPDTSPDLGPDLGPDPVALARREPHRLRAASEHHSPNLGPRIFEGEIPVAARGAGQIGNFAANPDQRETAFKQAAHGAVQLGNCEDFPHESWLGRRRSRRDGACGGKPIHKPSSVLDVDRNARPPSEEIFNLLIYNDLMTSPLGETG